MIKIGENTVPLTDAGNAQLFAYEHHDDLLWVPEWGTWMKYDGRRWARVSSESLITLAVQTARRFYQRAASETDEDARKALAMHAKSMEGAGRLKAMIDLARGFMIAKASDFDRNPWLLNLINGTVNLYATEMEFREHRRGDMITKITPIIGEQADCPRWIAFLERVLPDPAVRAWLQRFIGYCLTGDVGAQVLAFFHGRGANGKSTALEVLMFVLGEYAKSGAPDLLLAKHGESHPTEIADLQSARLVVCQETEAGRQWAESLIKRITGGDRIKARWMRENFFEFDPTHKLVVSANHRPKVRGQDEAIWRRIRLVPFDVTIPPEERDPELAAKLRAEAAGILGWCIEGCIAWQRDGLGQPPAIVEATKEYRSDQDHLGKFVADCCQVEAGAFESTTALYAAYTSWCARSGDKPWTLDSFREGLEERGYMPKRTKVARGFTGVRIVTR